jgi:hypothetical protein
MNFIKYFIISTLVILIVCTIFSLIGRYFLINRKKEIKNKLFIIGVCDFIIKLFLAWHIPLLLLQTIFSIIDMFTLLNGISRLFTTIFIAIISIIIERIIEYTRFNDFFKGLFSYEPNNTAVFAYIDLYREIEKINLGLINKLSISQSSLLSQFETTNKEANFIMGNIDNYVQIQNSECQKLLEIKNNIDNFFNELSKNIEDFCNVFKQYEKKLENSCNALIYYEEGGSLIADINESFQSKFKQSSNDFMRRLDDIEHQLKRIVDEYSKFNNLIQPHTQKISVYNARMDNILQSLKDGIDFKQTKLLNTSKEIAGVIKEANENINETLKLMNLYLNKNTFVLSTIFDTYKDNPLTPYKLKKTLKNWPAIKEKE